MTLGNYTNLTLANVCFILDLGLSLMSCHCLDRSRIGTNSSGRFCKVYNRIRGNRFMGQIPVKTGDGLLVAELLKHPETVRSGQ